MDKSRKTGELKMSTNVDDMKQIQQLKGRKLNLKIKLIIITKEMNNEDYL